MKTKTHKIMAWLLSACMVVMMFPVSAFAAGIPALANGVSFADDDANDTSTIITLGEPSVADNTFVYKISDDDNAVSAPDVGEDLSSWTAVTNGDSITAANGKHIGVAEVDSDTKAVQFSDGVAVTEAEATQIPVLANGVSFADDDANDTNTIITLGEPSVAGDTFVYKISDDDNAVSAPDVGEDLSSWTAVTNGDSITAANGKHIGVAEVDGDTKAVQFSDGVAVTEAEYSIVIGNETLGGAGITRTITTEGADKNQYLVIQITEGTGTSAHVSVVMVKAEDSVTVSYKTTAKVQVWLTNKMPTLNGSEATGATVYATKTAA